MHYRKLIIFISLAVLFAFYILVTENCSPKQKDDNNQLTEGNEYVGDQKCQSCHQKEHGDWKTSDHFKAMELPSDSTVLGDFNNASFSADGVISRFFRKDGKFFINTQGPDGMNHDYQVQYTFGYYPLQQYLIAFPGGRMQVPRVSWDSRKKHWFHQYEGQKILPSDWMHWTKGAQNWNTMCATCHSTNLQKNYFLDADSFHTTYSVINVSCESCHGAGKKHIDFVSSEAYKKGEKVTGFYLGLGRGNTQTEQINACVPCHALGSTISKEKIASGELLDDYIPVIPATEQFYGDGQVKGEVYSYTSFLQSKMFQRGVKCSNCHNPHTGKVLFLSNQLCLQCHSKKYDDPSHHFHTVNTEGAQCKNCHMPTKAFMEVDIRHDHSFRIPRPDLSVLYGTPNACTNCHIKNTSQWAADAVVKWYGPKRKYNFAEDLLPGSKTDANSEVHLIKLLNDTAISSMVKAAAATYLGNIYSEGSVTGLRKALLAGSALLRYQALRSLVNFPPEQWQDVAAPLLSDKVRAVRIAAADLFLTLPADRLPQQYRSAFAGAKMELEQYLRYQADFASGNVQIADYYLKQNDYNNAIRFYLRGLKMDSLMNYARLNLSTALSAKGKNQEALKVLEDAAVVDSKNDRIYYNLGLLYNEMQKVPEAMKSFEKAVSLKSSNPRVYFNYGLLLFQVHEINKAEQVLLKGLAISPQEGDLNYAIAFLYVKTGQLEKARKYAAILKKIDPDNSNYQSIFQAVL